MLNRATATNRSLSVPGPGAFLRWWGRGLRACLPAFLDRLLDGSTSTLVLQPVDDELVLLQERASETRELDRYPLRALDELRARLRPSRQLVLRLPAERVLAKTLSLPLAAEANLRQVVGFEMDRLTPFTPAQVYYDAYLLERQPALRRLRVRFVAAPRAWVDALLEQLAAAGVAPGAIDVAGESSTFNLLPPEKRPRSGRMVRRLRWALAILALVLTAAAGALPLWQQRSLIVNHLLPGATVAQQEAEQVLALREQLDQSIESSRFLVQKRRQVPRMIDLLNELTTLLPDGTWVERLEIQGDEVHIRGQSDAAADLVGLVEASERFHGATFRSPVTTDRRTGQDRFYLYAKVVREP